MKRIIYLAVAAILAASCIEPVIKADIFDAAIYDVIPVDASGNPVTNGVPIHSGDKFMVRLKANKSSFILNEIRLGYSESSRESDVILPWTYRNEEIVKDIRISGDKDSYYEFVCQTGNTTFTAMKKPFIFITLTDETTGEKTTLRKNFIVYPYLGTSIVFEDVVKDANGRITGEIGEAVNVTKDGKYVLISGQQYYLTVRTGHESFGIKDYVGDFDFDEFKTDRTFRTEKDAPSDIVGAKRFLFTAGDIMNGKLSQEKSIRFILYNDDMPDEQKYEFSFKVCAKAEFSLEPVIFSEDSQPNITIRSAGPREQISLSEIQLDGTRHFNVYEGSVSDKNNGMPFDYWFNTTQESKLFNFHEDNLQHDYKAIEKITTPTLVVDEEERGTIYLKVYDPITEKDYKISAAYETRKTTKSTKTPNYFGIEIGKDYCELSNNETSPVSVKTTTYATDDDIITVSLFVGGKAEDGSELETSTLIQTGIEISISEEDRQYFRISTNKNNVTGYKVTFENNGTKDNMNVFYVKAISTPTGQHVPNIEIKTVSKLVGTEMTKVISAQIQVYITRLVALVVDIDTKDKAWYNMTYTKCHWTNIPYAVTYSIREWEPENLSNILDAAANKGEPHPVSEKIRTSFRDYLPTYGEIRAKHMMEYNPKSLTSKNFALMGTNVQGMVELWWGWTGHSKKFERPDYTLKFADLSFKDNFTYNMSENKYYRSVTYEAKWNEKMLGYERLNTDNAYYSNIYPVEFWTLWADAGIYEIGQIMGTVTEEKKTEWKRVQYIIDPKTIEVSKEFVQHYKLHYIVYRYKFYANSNKTDYCDGKYWSWDIDESPAVVRVNSVETY